MKKEYDIIVVGGGHAGCEAAFAGARAGAQVLLITQNLDHIGQMSCNPAIGGIGKGQVVREVDALGGMQGIVTDAAAIQFRLLNRAKGPAVQSPRSQCDKLIYQHDMKNFLEQTANIDILQSEVISLRLENHLITGVETLFGDFIPARALVIASGTFLNGKLHYGLRHFSGGRAGDAASTLLSQSLSEKLKLRMGRLKTGTPPRLLAQSIDFSQMGRQESEKSEEEFSYWSANLRPELTLAAKRNLPCYTVYSALETAEIVRANLDQAPLYQGKIEGIGARYCPSFEDKVMRFAHHPRHLLYLEPESFDNGEYYINGISTSLPPEIQRRMIASVPGLEKATITRYAYAIEYDFIFPDQIDRSLTVKAYPNLFTAGQINGTSGYEEAAGQGVIAGLNAARYAAGKSVVELTRDSSYIGVMIDDLVTKEIVEPYRLFTSRAEYRLHLRQDNANLRLCDKAYEWNLLPEAKYREFSAYREVLKQLSAQTKSTKSGAKTLFEELKVFHGDYEAFDTARRSDTLPFPAKLLPDFPDDRTGRSAFRELLIEAHYDGYLQREKVTIKRLGQLEEWSIPADFDYALITTLRNESRQKLEKIRPSTLAQASRIDGVNPAELALLQIHLARRRQEDKSDA